MTGVSLDTEYCKIGNSGIKGAGKGVFAKVNIPKGTILGEYTGYYKSISTLTKEEERYSLGVSKTMSIVGENIMAYIKPGIIAGRVVYVAMEKDIYSDRLQRKKPPR